MQAHLVRADVSDQDARMLTRRTTPGLSFYAVMLVVVAAPVVVFGYLAIALHLIAPVASLTGRRG